MSLGLTRINHLSDFSRFFCSRKCEASEPSLDKSVLPSVIVIVECWAGAGKVEIHLQLLSYPQCKSVCEEKKEQGNK